MSSDFRMTMVSNDVTLCLKAFGEVMTKGKYWGLHKIDK